MSTKYAGYMFWVHLFRELRDWWRKADRDTRFWVLVTIGVIANIFIWYEALR